METRSSPRKAAKRPHPKKVANGKRSPLPRCDSVTAQDHISPAHSKLRKRERAWSPIGLAENYDGNFPALSSTENRSPKKSPVKSPAKSPRKSTAAEDEFVWDPESALKDISAQMQDKTWAELMEEQENNTGSDSPQEEGQADSAKPQEEKSKRKLKFHVSKELTSELQFNCPSPSSGLPKRHPTPVSPAKQKGRKRGSKTHGGPGPSSFQLLRSPPSHSNLVDAANDDSQDGGALRRSPRKRPSTFSRNLSESIDAKQSRKESSRSPSPIHFHPKNVESSSPRRSTRNSGFNSLNSSATGATLNDRPKRYSRPPHRYPEADWKDPTKGWVMDTQTLDRRTRDLDKGYNTEVYQRYISEIPNKRERTKGIHPMTPNKYLKFSRRSWDQQVKLWRRELYAYYGETCSNISSLISPSDCSETSSLADPSEFLASENLLSEGLSENVNEAVSELLAPFDIDSRRGFNQEDDATMGSKSRPAATEDTNTLVDEGKDCEGPVDFSCLSGNKSS